jgi:hypothetical protein
MEVNGLSLCCMKVSDINKNTLKFPLSINPKMLSHIIRMKTLSLKMSHIVENNINKKKFHEL